MGIHSVFLAFGNDFFWPDPMTQCHPRFKKNEVLSEMLGLEGLSAQSSKSRKSESKTFRFPPLMSSSSSSRGTFHFFEIGSDRAVTPMAKMTQTFFDHTFQRDGTMEGSLTFHHAFRHTSKWI